MHSLAIPRGALQDCLHTLYALDADTWEHSKRVAYYARLLAAQLGLAAGQQELIQLTALLHDIGKLDIPEHILKKPGRLTQEEFLVIQQHPELGWKRLSCHRFDSRYEQLLQGVLHHHERWDGTGYPAGLQGERIPFIARLLCIADCFAAMTESRPYKKGLPLHRALEELQRQKGKQFDPVLVDAFLTAYTARLQTAAETG